MESKTATLTVELGKDSASSDTCSNAILFQVKEGNILPGQSVHFLFFGLDFLGMDAYTILDSSLRPCTLVSSDATATGKFKASVSFEEGSRIAHMPWPFSAIRSVRAKTGLVGVTPLNTLKGLYSKGASLSEPIIARRGHCCIEYMDNTVDSVIGIIEAEVSPPRCKEYSSPVVSGSNPFFIMKGGELVKTVYIDIPESEATEVPIGQSYSVNLYYIDADTGAPISGVDVILGGSRFAQTGLSGQVYFMGLDPGTYTLTASKNGYYTTNMDDLDNDTIVVG